MREEDPCGRCGRLTAHDDLRLHTTRERLREFTRRAPPAVAAQRVVPVVKIAEVRVTEPSGAPQAALSPPPVNGEATDASSALAARPPASSQRRGRAVSYRWVTHAHVLCPECHAVVERNAHRLHDHDRRRFVVMLIAGLMVAALIWLSFTTFMPNWIAAFWRNGAGGR